MTQTQGHHVTHAPHQDAHLVSTGPNVGTHRQPQDHPQCVVLAFQALETDS